MKYCKHCQDSFELDSLHWNSRIKNNTIYYFCKIKKKSYDLKYNKIHSEKRKRYGKEHRKIYKEYYKRKERIRSSNDINFILKKRLRSRLLRALKSNYKTGSAVKDLGCSVEEFKIYLESKFKDGMTWENRNLWHIDHIKPLSKFDLTNREQLLKACHYTNLQPLWAEDNLKKQAKELY